MQVDGHVHRFGRFEHRRELRLVEIVAQRVAVDDHGAHAELVHGAVDFLRGIRGILRRHGDHAGVARGVLAAGFGELVVGVDGERGAGGRVEHLHARGGERDDLVVDAAGIHVAETAVAEILQPFVDVAGTFAGVRAIEAPQAAESGVVEALVRQQLVVAREHVLRDEGFFGGNAQIVDFVYHSIPQIQRPESRTF